ncbi:MAG TPA: hypothetical protein VI383_08540, partial [Gemmatimonadales bacterium]|nr:hypothetical protein [Gemmatimonadales bacterium]
MTETLTRSAPAKVNLFLRVLAREANGYHGLETLMARIELADSLTARRAEGTGVTMTVTGAEVGPAADNLAFRAAEAVLEAIRVRFAVALTLDKRIPAGAGLGGGSADAAAALLLVNRLAGDAVPRAELFNLAARLGSDVAYCLSEAPLALAWGRGERMITLAPLPTAPVLLVCPPMPVSTAEAYGWIDEARIGSERRGALVLEPDALRSWSDVARMAGND